MLQMRRSYVTIAAALLAIAASGSYGADDQKLRPVASAIAKAMGKLRAADDMLAALNAHASLDPKAIEEQGKSANPSVLVPACRVGTRQFRERRQCCQLEYLRRPGQALPGDCLLPGGGWLIANKDVYDGGGCRGSAAEPFHDVMVL
jgi:acetyl esterase